MKEREFYIPSSDGISKLHGLAWIPDGEIRACLQIIHGMTEHIGRYREFASYLAERGIAVYGHDQIGHGDTASCAEDRGFFGEKDGSNFLVRDARRLSAWGRKRYPGVKHFLLGHSMGSFVARRYLTVYDDGPDGVILLGTGAPLDAEVAAGYALTVMLGKKKGLRYRSKLLYDLSLGSYNRCFAPTETAFDWLSRDREKIEAFAADEKSRFTFTVGAYRDLFCLLLKTFACERKGLVRTDAPVLFLAGDADPVGEKTKGVRRVYRWYDAAGAEDLTVGFYEGARHEILNEINRQEVYGDILEWMEKYLFTV